jgi:replication-associated recombination protein RarA
MKFKGIIAFLLLIGIVANCFNYLIIESSYKFNKSYISQVLCTNKDKPHLNCNGKCFLDIKLKELEQKNKKEQEHLKHIVETTAPYFVEISIKNPEFELSRITVFYLQQKPSTIPLVIFHPPKLV